VSLTFDGDALLLHGGLAVAGLLAQRLAVAEVIDEHVTLSGGTAANSGAKVGMTVCFGGSTPTGDVASWASSRRVDLASCSRRSSAAGAGGSCSGCGIRDRLFHQSVERYLWLVAMWGR